MRLRFVFVAWAIISTCYGQQTLDIPELSPPGTIEQKVGFTTVSIYYERPAARGRSEAEIFGKLVPFGKVWRTGAGNCTTITFDKGVMIGEKWIAAGRYALFTIPDRDQWTVILNTDTLAYGAYAYDEKKDVVRTIAEAKQSARFYEALTIDIDFVPNDARIYISWLNTQISFPLKTGVDDKIKSFIHDNLIVRESKDPELYISAIQYYLWHRMDRRQVMKFINKGISLREDRIWYYWKIEELIKDEKYDEAFEASERAIKVIGKSNESEPRKDELIYDFKVYQDRIRQRKR